jgi:hypothetical protein
MVEALPLRVPPGDRRVPAPAFINRTVSKLVLWQDWASGELVVASRLNEVDCIFPDGGEIVGFERRVLSQDFAVRHFMEAQIAVDVPKLDPRISDERLSLDVGGVDGDALDGQSVFSVVQPEMDLARKLPLGPT